MSERGTKVTTDPESYQNPVREGAGAVTSDSLAGESIEQGRAFAEKNPGVGSMKQNPGSTTLNNTDTSNATTLPSAPDAQAREAQGEWNESRQLNAGSNLGKDAGVGPTYNTSSSGGNSGSGSGSGGFSSGGFSSGGDGSAFGSEESGIRGERTRATAAQHEQQAAGGISTATNDRSERAGENVSTAPSYVDADERVTAGTGHQKPKGKNLKENEGFDGNEPNASFNSDVLSKDDPARLQEQKLLNRDAGVGGGSMGGQGGFGGQSGVNNDNSFGGLRDESA